MTIFPLKMQCWKRMFLNFIAFSENSLILILICFAKMPQL